MSSGPSLEIKKTSPSDIAIIGIGLKFPKAETPQEFWNILAEGKCCIGKISETRKSVLEKYCNFMGIMKRDYERGAYLEEIDKFDFEFFRLSPKEAELMDPNQRLFLETACKAIEDAGYCLSGMKGANTGVFVGFSGDSDYRSMITNVEPESFSLAVPGNLHSIIGSRLSYILDLRGPNLMVNTLCSSSLVALHLACESIRRRECDTAIAGGVQIYILPFRQALLGIESSNGKTMTFDDRADGTVGGEGIAAVYLKPLSRALRDRDNIYAVIKGSSVNQDGSSIGISAPNPEAQERVILKAWENARLNPESISFIEAHGTGTKLGDPIEIEGLQRAFGKYTKRKQFCAISSVKTNIGHTDSTAGIAGIIKSALSLRNRTVPPSLFFKKPNRNIRFHESPVFVNTTSFPLDSSGGSLYGCVSSFGFSGTNCHLVLESAPERGETNAKDPSKGQILLLSAGYADGLSRLIEEYKKLEINESSLRDMCYTNNTGRDHYTNRIAIIFSSWNELQNKLHSLNFPLDGNCGIGGVFIGKNDGRGVGGGNKDQMRKSENNLSCLVNEKIKAYVESGKKEKNILMEIAALYAEGADGNWEELYSREKRWKILVPTYPFKKNSCWINIPDQKKIKPRAVLESIFFKTEWRIKKEAGSNSITRQKMIVYGDESGFKRTLMEMLGTGNTLIAVKNGNFQNDISLWNPQNIDKILLVVNSESSLPSCLAETIYDIFKFLDFILKSNLASTELLLLTDNGTEVNFHEDDLIPENNALVSLIKVFSLENPKIKCRCIDYDQYTSVDHLISEISSGSKDFKTAFRNNVRYIEELTDLSYPVFGNSNITIKENGLYIITGGLGGLGLITARYLASQNKTKIVLFNRSPFPEKNQWNNIADDLKHGQSKREKIKQLLDIEGMGSEVFPMVSDVTNENSVKSAIERVNKDFGQIDGIFHCAAIGVGMIGNRIEETDFELFKRLIAPKIKGAQLLSKHTDNTRLDFFVLFSSPITLTGGIGSSGYAVGNAFLDSFALARNKRGKKTITLSWAPWNKTLEKYNQEFDEERYLFKPLNEDEISRALHIVLQKEIPHVLVGRLNLKSSIFDLEDFIPFSFNRSLLYEINTIRCELKKVDDEDPDDFLVELSSEDENRKTTRTERKIANILGKYLGYSHLKENDNFYDLGGDSIIALQIANAVNRKFTVTLGVVDIFKNPTIKKLSRLVEEKHFGSPDINILPFQSTVEKPYYPVSPAQKRIYLLCQRKETKTTWNIFYIFEIQGDLDVKHLELSFKKLVERHEVLRSFFHIFQGAVVQEIEERTDFELGVTRLKETDDIDQHTHEFVKEFDLSKAPLLRAEVVFGESAGYMLIDIHHIISDFVTMETLLSDLRGLYNNQTPSPLKFQYKDYSQWYLNYLETENADLQKRFWLEKLKDIPEPVRLPPDFAVGKKASYSSDVFRFDLKDRTFRKLQKFAKENDATVFWVLLSILYLTLFKVTAKKEIIVALPVRGRFLAEIESMPGMFINVLPVGVLLDPTASYKAILEDIKDQIMKAYKNQYYSFDLLAESLNLSGEDLFSISMQLHDKLPELIEINENLRLINRYRNVNYVQNDIHIDIYPDDRKYILNIIYANELFYEKTIESFINNYCAILDIVLEEPGLSLNAVIAAISRQDDGAKDFFEDFNNDPEHEAGKEIIVCSYCKEPLIFQRGEARCPRCGSKFGFENGFWDMRGDNSAAEDKSQAVKKDIIAGYNRVNDSLINSDISDFSHFLNLGYAYLDSAPNNHSHQNVGYNKYSNNLIFEMIGNNDLNNNRILEVGCGRGGNTAFIKRNYKEAIVYGIDISDMNIEFCVFNDDYANISFVCGDAESLPFAESTFDYVVNIESSHCYPNLEKFYSEIYRILKPQGRFLYADIFIAEDFNRNLKFLEAMSFSIERVADITENVLLACKNIAESRISLYKGRTDNVTESLNEFLAAPDSNIYRDMRLRKREYRMCSIIKVS